MLKIEICMGSSCYSRGNSRSLELIEAYITEKQLEAEISLSGKLCLGNCAEGPNIIINGNLHNSISPECVIDLVKHYITAENAE